LKHDQHIRPNSVKPVDLSTALAFILQCSNQQVIKNVGGYVSDDHAMYPVLQDVTIVVTIQ